MATTYTLILLIVTALLAVFVHGNSSKILFALILIFAVLVGCGVIPSAMVKHLQSYYVAMPEPQWKNKNAIVILGGGLS